MSQNASRADYTGRFAPSPTGPLHAGSLLAALASWLDARAHHGRWLLRIEDIDGPRCVPGAEEEIVRQLDALGLHADAPPQRQSDRNALYREALDRLVTAGLAYPCRCSRREIALANVALGLPPTERHGELVYPGTCRGRHLAPGEGTAWRLTVPHGCEITWDDRRLGLQHQRVDREVGDFVLQRADGVWAYQLAVVVDDAAQGITDVVRGEDLADNTPRQILLQRLLGLPTPRYLHTPLVMGADGEKLSKQNGARPLDAGEPLAALRVAATQLGLGPLAARDLHAWLREATNAWAARWADAGA